MFFTCLSVGAVRATFVFSTSSLRVFHRGVRYRNDTAAQAATKSLPRAVPDATLVRGVNCTEDRISCCSWSSVTPRASRTNLFQSARQLFNNATPFRCMISSFRVICSYLNFIRRILRLLIKVAHLYDCEKISRQRGEITALSPLPVPHHLSFRFPSGMQRTTCCPVCPVSRGRTIRAAYAVPPTAAVSRIYRQDCPAQ